MKIKIQTILTALLALFLCFLFASILMTYSIPMQDFSLNLSLTPEGEGLFEESYDEKGWTVFTREGERITRLTPNGFGDYSGVEPGQTFYFSRVLSEELDDPTIKIGAANRTFSVFLDNTLIYTDHPELDNRIGYLTLPMNEWDRSEDILISLPLDYQNKTLTIAQSMPEATEADAATLLATPCDIWLYCGYSYESELIAESFQTALLAAAAFIVGTALLIFLIITKKMGYLCLAIVAFLQMSILLLKTTFYSSYFGNQWYDISGICSMLSIWMLLLFLTSRCGKGKKLLWGFTLVYTITFIISAAVALRYPRTDSFAVHKLHVLYEWSAAISFLFMIIMAFLFWRRENRFYKIFTPVTAIGLILYWVFLFWREPSAKHAFSEAVKNGSVTYFYRGLYTTIMGSTLFSALLDAILSEQERHTEKKLMEKHRRLALDSYENMRHQHEEILMLRHDMVGHLQTLKNMTTETTVNAYLENLIGQNQAIRSVVQSGNEMLDIILNSKLSTAADHGIKMELEKISAPPKLPLRDTDLCSLIINILDNAINAASYSFEPFIRLDLHTKNNFFVIVCENSADTKNKKERTQKTVQMHGLGLKIIQRIAERYQGLLDTESTGTFYKIRIAFPLS